MGLKYRSNVAGILRDCKGNVLICERVGLEGAWQFPQGGLDQGESVKKALYRELEEEIGITRDLCEIVEQRGGYRYKFDESRLKFGNYGGQEQTYFLCDFLGKKDQICIETKHPEFQQTRWIKPDEFLIEWVPKFKQDVYRDVFKDFFGVALV